MEEGQGMIGWRTGVRLGAYVNGWDGGTRENGLQDDTIHMRTGSKAVFASLLL